MAARSITKRKHNPELLRAKRAARALNIRWADVTRERNRLRQNELDQRGHEDEARKVAWGLWLKLSGWSESHKAFWRSGFQRVYGAKLAAGADCDSIRHHDVVAETVRQNCPEFSSWETGDIWDLLLGEYPPLRPIWEHYQTALLRLAACQLPAGDQLADDGSELETPF